MGQRGRPKGSKNKVATVARYFPKNWLPIHEAMVLAAFTGSRTYEEIGKEYGYTGVQVGNLCRSPQALELRERLRKQLNDQGLDLSVKLSRIQEKALKRVEDFIDDETRAVQQPALVADYALKVARSIGPQGVTDPDAPKASKNVTNNTNITNINNTAILTSPDFLKDIKDGLAKSAQVMELQNEHMKRLEDGRK